jgi:hypothetical protein
MISSLGQCSAVDFGSEGRLYLFHRGKRPILCFDRNGRFLRSWGDDLVGKAHGLRVDAGDNIWVTDIGNHMVYKFSSEGKLLSGTRADRQERRRDRSIQPADRRRLRAERVRSMCPTAMATTA